MNASFPVKTFLLGLLMSAALIGCSDSSSPPGAGSAKPVGDVNAGRAIAERECRGCHGLDGKGAAPAIPHLAGQRDRYLLASIAEYRDGKRTHAALRAIAGNLTQADEQNVAAYYSSLPPVSSAAAKDGEIFSPFEHGKTLAPNCTRCHGEMGNSTTPGTPTLAGQQPRYFVTATQEYLNGARETAPMHGLIRGLNRMDLESIALYFASQAPAARPAPPTGDPAAGEPATAVCGGCHGSHGVSADAATPTLAGQDPQYLIASTKAYRTSRKHEAMKRAVNNLSDTEIENIAAFYAVQKSRPAENGETLVQELTDKCNRCHSSGRENPSMAVPNIRGQDKDYLIMALRAYRDDRRESSVMHRMSLPYGDAIIEAMASFYASQPAQ